MQPESKIVIILVLFKQPLEESLAYATLGKHISGLQIPYKLIIYNNSPDITVQTPPIANCEVVNAQGNEMLASPYNHAWEVAKREQYDWIMLLDQDSELTHEYFSAVKGCLLNAKPQTAAIVPDVFCGTLQVSPIKKNILTGPYGHLTVAKESYEGSRFTYVDAVNSGSILRTEAISQINGFSEEFPLDFLDCWNFYQFHRAGYSIELMNAPIQHHLSALESFNGMGETRYKSFMQACARFAKKSNPMIYLTFKARILCRCIKQLMSKSERKFLKITFHSLIS